jgi:hypothetical protein
MSAAVHKLILDELNKVNIPLSAKAIEDRLAEQDIVFSQQYIKRNLNSLTAAGITELVGKHKKTELYTIKGKSLDPWEADTVRAKDPNFQPRIKINGAIYSPDRLALDMHRATNGSLTEANFTEIINRVVLLLLGSASYETLRLHSITPVGHVRQPLIEANERLKTFTKMIDTVLNNPSVRNGSTGQAISDRTRDYLMAELEPWLIQLSTNIRSNIE